MDFYTDLTAGELDDAVHIWRYIDLPKLIDMLKSNSLWLARADHLGDPQEGRYTDNYGLPASGSGGSILLQQAELMRFCTYVNCWIQLEHESMAMWQLYTSAGQGVGVTSTVGRLRKCLACLNASIQSDAQMYLGKVLYDQVSHLDGANDITRFLSKRKPFEYEHELRILAQLPPSTYEALITAGPPYIVLDNIAKGLRMNIEPSSLIEEVVVSPLQGPLFKAAVDVVIEKLAPQIDVKHSSLYVP